MLKKRFISLTLFRKKNALDVSEMELPMILTSNKVPLVAVVRITAEIMAAIQASEAKAQQAKE